MKLIRKLALSLAAATSILSLSGCFSTMIAETPEAGMNKFRVQEEIYSKHYKEKRESVSKPKEPTGKAKEYNPWDNYN